MWKICYFKEIFFLISEYSVIKVILFSVFFWHFGIYFGTRFYYMLRESRDVFISSCGYVCWFIVYLVYAIAMTRWTVNTDSNSWDRSTRYIPQTESGLFVGAMPELLAPCDICCSFCCTAALCRLFPTPALSTRNLSSSLLLVCILLWMKTYRKMRRIGVNEQVNISEEILDYINETRNMNIVEFTSR